MPCQSSYLAPNEWEKYARRVAGLCVRLHELLGLPVPEQAKRDAADIYGGQDWAPVMCSILSSMDETVREDFLYSDPKSRARRELATWWEDHVEQDRARVNREIKALKQKEEREAAIAKLTPHERSLLGVTE